MTRTWSPGSISGDAPHAKVGAVRQLGSPMRFSKTPVRRDKAAPLLGEDTADLLGELGIS